MPQYFFNPADHTTASGIPTGLSAPWGMTHPVSIVEDAATTYGKVLRIGAASAVDPWALVVDSLGTYSGTVEVLIKARLGSIPFASSPIIGAAARVTGADGTEGGWGSAIYTGSTKEVRLYELPSTAKVNGPSIAVSAGTWFFQRVRVTAAAGVGGQDQAFFRSWLGAIGDEPVAWDGSFDLPSTTSGKIGIWGRLHTAGDKDVEWFGVGTAGDSAPPAPVASNTAPTQPGALSPPSGSTITGTATLSWGASTDAESDPITYSGRYRLDAGAWVDFGPQAGLSYAVPGVADGALDFEVWAHDGTTAGPTRAGTYTVDNNDAPLVEITAPATGTTIHQGASVTLTATATDAEDGDLSAAVQWSSSIDGPLGAGASLQTAALSPGVHALTASVTDSGSATDTDAITLTVNARPVVEITAPAPGSTHGEDDSISFAGTATDAEDGALSGAALVWTSDVDGELGTGAALSTDALSLGEHVVTLTATDSGGATGSASITITVSACALRPEIEVEWRSSARAGVRLLPLPASVAEHHSTRWQMRPTGTAWTDATTVDTGHVSGADLTEHVFTLPAEAGSYDFRALLTYTPAS